MRKTFNDLNIKIQVEKRTISVLNIAVEKFMRMIPKHSHGSNSYELHYIEGGYGSVFVEGIRYNITPNTLYITGPFVSHEQIPDVEDPMVEYTLYFKVEEKRDTHKDNLVSGFEEVDFWFGQDTSDIRSVISQIFDEMETKDVGYKEEVKALLIQCIVRLVRNYRNRTPGKEDLSLNIEDNKSIIIEESFLYDFSTITLEALSKRLGLSKRQAERYIKKYYGKTFREMKNEAKMSAAKMMLHSQDISITEIANQLNYSSLQHFSHAFKQFYNISASEYKNSAKPLDTA